MKRTINRQVLRTYVNKVLPIYYYFRLRRPKQWGWGVSEENRLLEGLHQLGIEVQDVSLNIREYKHYFRSAEYSIRYPRYYPDNIAEKSLEHFIAQQMLHLEPSDVYVDIASEGSPVPEIYHRLHGCATYAQDLAYDLGLNGNKIGSDAASLPLPDGSVTKMALHCSFEHFEGDSDSDFIKEAARVLRIGGVFVIVPLYLSTTYLIMTDLLVSRSGLVSFEPDAVVTYVKGWGNRHGRFYDPSHLSSRVLSRSGAIQFRLFRITNAKDISESAYARFALVGTRVDPHTDGTLADESQ